MRSKTFRTVCGDQFSLNQSNSFYLVRMETSPLTHFDSRITTLCNLLTLCLTRKRSMRKMLTLSGWNELFFPVSQIRLFRHLMYSYMGMCERTYSEPIILWELHWLVDGRRIYLIAFLQSVCCSRNLCNRRLRWKL